MLKVLIKNYLKLIFRSTMSYVIGIVCPIFLIITTSISLEQSLPSRIEVGQAKLGYAIELKEEGYKNLIEALKEQNVQLVAMSKEQGILEIAKGSIDGYLEKSEKGYKIYLPELLTDKSVYLKSMVTLLSHGMEIEEVLAKGNHYIQHKKVIASPSKTSKNYYGMIEFMGCVWTSAYLAGMISAAERKSKLFSRMGKMGIKPYQIWASRFIPTLIGYYAMSLVVAVWLTVGLKIDWGVYAGKVILYILFVMFCFTLLSTFLSFLFKQDSLFVIMTWIVWIVVGFLGGNFQNTWQNFACEKLQRVSIFYYTNRSLMELSMYGESKYLQTSLVILGLMGFLSIVLSLLWIKLGRWQKDESMDFD